MLLNPRPRPQASPSRSCGCLVAQRLMEWALQFRRLQTSASYPHHSNRTLRLARSHDVAKAPTKHGAPGTPVTGGSAEEGGGIPATYSGAEGLGDVLVWLFSAFHEPMRS